MKPPRSDIHWRPDDEYKKACWQLRRAYMELLDPLRMYGQSDYVDEAVMQSLKLAEDFSLVTRGVNKIIVFKK